MFHFDTTFDIVRLRREELIDATTPRRRRTIRERLGRSRRRAPAASRRATVVRLAPAASRAAPGGTHHRAA